MSIKSTLARVSADRYTKPDAVGICGIDPAIRQRARDDLTSDRPDYAGAVSALEAANHLASDPGALRTLAGARLLMGQAEESIALLEQAERVLHEELAINYASRAMSHIKLRELDTAVGLGKRAIEAFAGNYMGHVNLGAAYLEQGNLDAALQVVRDLSVTWPEGLHSPELRARILQDDGQWAYLRASPDHAKQLEALFSINN